MKCCRDNVPLTVLAVVQRAEAIRESELRRLLSRCPGLSERERMLIAAMSTALIERLLHGAVAKISEKAVVDGAQALSDAHFLNELFDARPIEHEESAVRMRSA